MLPRLLRAWERLTADAATPEEKAQRARDLDLVTYSIFAIATVFLSSLLYFQPDLSGPVWSTLPRIWAACLVVLALNRLGWTRAAAVLLIAAVAARIRASALPAGGVRSPGVQSLYVLPMIATLILGSRWGAAAMAGCVLISLSLLRAELAGTLPPQVVRYNPVSIWLLNSIYLALVVLVMHLLTRGIRAALASARERVKELGLLHAAARLLREDRPFEPRLLEEVASMIPAAMLRPELGAARASYMGHVGGTPNWKQTPWLLRSGFATAKGSGALEVVYLEKLPDEGEGPFLKEERAMLDSLAEMLGAYLERQYASERRQLAEAQLRQSQKMEALGTMAGGIAHDFNNILTAIGGNAELALAQLPKEHALRLDLGEILAAHRRAVDLVKRILLFSRKKETSRKAIDLTHVVDEALELLRRSLPRDVAVKRAYARGLPPVHADASQLHQVVMNLGVNAGHAMAERGGTLTVSLEVADAGESDARKPQVVLSVEDTGKGMTPEVRERLFEPFFTTKGLKGTGLGLSVVHGIIQDHGGAIQVQSQPGNGTRFVVFLPATNSPAETPASLESSATDGAGGTVMLVDDEASVLAVLERQLTRLNYRCRAFTDSEAALAAYRAEPAAFAAVVTDLSMPRLSGYELARKIRVSRPDAAVIVLSGNHDAQARPAEGEFVLLDKPVSAADLSEALRGLLAGR
jgi:signal transduction histidine kinase